MIDEVAADVAREWNLTLGEKMTGGTVAHVFEALDGDGRACVLKVLPELGEADGDYAAERDLLVAAKGGAYVEILRHDDERQAMLLERLGPKMADDGRSCDEWIDDLCDLLVEAWQVDVAPTSSMWTAASKCEWFVDFLDRKWREYDEPCPRSVIDEALIFVERRGAAFDPSTSIVVHGDAHAWNALQATGGGYRFIDPDPFFAEPAADTAVPMREWSGELLRGGDPRRATIARCTRVAAKTGCDPQDVWEWGYIERVSTALVGLSVPHKVGPMADWFVVSEACLGVTF